MKAKEKVRPNLPALIDEAQRVYEREPIEAARMMYDGICGLESPATTPASGPGWQQLPPTHGESILQRAFWTLKVMGEDAQIGIVPTSIEWGMNVAVAESILRMMGATDGPT